MKQLGVNAYAALTFAATVFSVAGLIAVIFQTYQISSLMWNIAAICWLFRGDTPVQWNRKE